MSDNLDIPAFLRIRAARRKAATPCKNESKSWALPAAATNRKTKIPPTREFLAHTDFSHGLRDRGGAGPSGPGGCPSQARAVPSAQVPPSLTASRTLILQQSSTRRNAETENARSNHTAGARDRRAGRLLQGSGTPSSEDVSQKTFAPLPHANRIASGPHPGSPKLLAPVRRRGLFLPGVASADTLLPPSIGEFVQ